MKLTQRKRELRNELPHLPGNIPPLNVLIMEANTLPVKASLSRVFCYLQPKQPQLILYSPTKFSRIPGTK